MGNKGQKTRERETGDRETGRETGDRDTGKEMGDRETGDMERRVVGNVVRGNKRNPPTS